MASATSGKASKGEGKRGGLRDRSAGRAGIRGADRAAGDGRTAREEAILAAALEIFGQKGFAAARLDDVAAKAGVAKGTLYLYFPSKAALFQGLLRSAIAAPMESAAQAMLARDQSAEESLRALIDFLRSHVMGTERATLLRLIVAEGMRFPELAEFHHREVVSRGVEAIRRIAEKGVASGEFRSDALRRFPQLAIAPVLLAVLWDGLFGRIEPLDTDAFLEAHLAVLMQGLKGAGS